MKFHQASIASILRNRSETHPDREIFKFVGSGSQDDVHLTYADLWRKSLQLATNLRQHVAPGERAVILLPPGADYVIALFACLISGVIAVPLYPPKRNRRDEKVLGIIENCTPSILIGTQKIRRQISGENGDLLSRKWMLLDQLSDVVSDIEGDAPNLNDVALLQYTSGSTSAPKGVKISQLNILRQAEFAHNAMSLEHHTKQVSWLPPYHDMGLFGTILTPFLVDVPCVLIQPMAFLKDPCIWLQTISDERASISGAPNFAFDLCVEKISEENCQDLDLSSLKLAYCGAEPIQKATLGRFAQKFDSFGFNPKAFFPCYGMSETTLMISGVGFLQGAKSKKLLPGQSAYDKEVVCVGTVPERVSLKIVQPESKVELQENEIGEIWCQGDMVSEGYWNNRELTSRNFKHQLNGKGEFFRTGDLGFISEGELYITGREKEMFIWRGQNYYPHDIEYLTSKAHRNLVSDGAVALCLESCELVVVQEIKRAARVFGDHQALVDLIRNAVTTQLEIEPKAIVLVKEKSLPRTTSGKKIRTDSLKAFLNEELKEVYRWSNKAVAKTMSENGLQSEEDVQELLLDLLSAATGLSRNSIGLDDSVFNMGLDSVAAVDITVTLESKLGVGLDASLLWEFQSIREISEFVFAEKLTLA